MTGFGVIGSSFMGLLGHGMLHTALREGGAWGEEEDRNILRNMHLESGGNDPECKSHCHMQNTSHIYTIH